MSTFSTKAVDGSKLIVNAAQVASVSQLPNGKAKITFASGSTQETDVNYDSVRKNLKNALEAKADSADAE